MTWTGSEAPHGGASDAAGLGGGGGWIPERLPPGALGADTRSADHGDVDGALFADLPPLPLTGPLADALSAARTAAESAAQASCYLASTEPDQRLDALRQTATTRDLLDATLLRLVSSFTPEQVRAVGATSLTDLVLTHTGADPKRAATEVRLATALTAPVTPVSADDGPDGVDGHGAPDGAGGPSAGSSAVALGRVGAAHAAGELSTDVAALAQRTVADLPARVRREQGTHADASLAELLPGLTHAQARIVCTTLAHRLDPDRADRGFDPDDIDKRNLTITVHADGSVDIRGHFDPVAGAAIKAAIDHHSKPDPTVHAPLADQQEPLPGLDTDRTAGRGDGDGDAGTRETTERVPPKAGVPVRDPRTAGQRRADALSHLVRSGVAGDHTRSTEGARVIVTTTDAALRGEAGAEPAHCETTDRPLTTAQLRVVACSGTLQAVRLSCEGADASALSLGRAVRLFSAGQRRAMLARDGGCAIPGCTAPPGWLEAHHVHEWVAGGPTDVDWGVLLCTRHHVLVTLGIWAVRMVDGVPHVRPPRAVDPLQRWVLNPRRGLRQRTLDRVGASGCGSPPPGRSSSPPGAAPSPPGVPLGLFDPPEPPVDAGCPDIPSRHGTCGC
ncbi:HNH endonuclease signature motif containing protein [Quadrisphaera setariae]|uniref:DUF222 domain-containing protein n=1 Tax=Quadrisphaera setariae TaxID=2593304 RepID=A0A5C8ZE42_9ACTN|nr:HNH endonuclease signature motif containing protein [Quadrisphaera setariae]TXR56325.1 DUF222 domain-containing protein [Quadrisphaera setariae]